MSQGGFYMLKLLPLFPTALLGSLPRSEKLLVAHRRLNSGKTTLEEFDNMVYAETEQCVRLQEMAGIDIITSGELGRDNYVSFVSEKLGGVRMMNMSEMLEYIDDKKAFEQILTTLDVPGVSIKNAICDGKLEYRGDIVLGELTMLKRLTDRPVKITLPGKRKEAPPPRSPVIRFPAVAKPVKPRPHKRVLSFAVTGRLPPSHRVQRTVK
jgi:5-methyltetrahydropteroyltriglutamate--homocysteine methyltransferase